MLLLKKNAFTNLTFNRTKLKFLCKYWEILFQNLQHSELCINIMLSIQHFFVFIQSLSFFASCFLRSKPHLANFTPKKKTFASRLRWYHEKASHVNCINSIGIVCLSIVWNLFYAFASPSNTAIKIFKFFHPSYSFSLV